MDKKSIIIGLLVIVILIGVGMFVFNNMNQNQIKVGDSSFAIPAGYYESTPNQNGDLNISNGFNSIYFAVYDDNDVNYYINDISDFIKSTNKTPLTSNFTVNGVDVYKLTIVNSTQYYRYWFVNNDKIYCIYTWDGNTNMDSVVISLIESMKN